MAVHLLVEAHIGLTVVAMRSNGYMQIEHMAIRIAWLSRGELSLRVPALPATKCAWFTCRCRKMVDPRDFVNLRNI